MSVLEDRSRLPARPRVSVLMLAYRHAEFIAQAVRSAVDQDALFDWEVLVSDDASPDGTPDILRRLQQEHPDRLRVFLHPANLGGSGRQNFAFLLSQARGEYLAMLEGDDFWCHRSKLARQVAVLDAAPDLAGCFHAIWAMDGTYAHVTRLEEPPEGKDRYGWVDFLNACRARTATVMVRRSCVPELPPWYFRHLAGDRCFHLLVSANGDYRYLPEPMAVYRIHPGGVWTRLTPAERSAHELEFCDTLVDVYGATHGSLVRSIRERTRFWGARNALRGGDRRSAWRLFGGFLRRLPHSRHVPPREVVSFALELTGLRRPGG